MKKYWCTRCLCECQEFLMDVYRNLYCMKCYYEIPVNTRFNGEPVQSGPTGQEISTMSKTTSTKSKTAKVTKTLTAGKMQEKVAKYHIIQVGNVYVQGCSMPWRDMIQSRNDRYSFALNLFNPGDGQMDLNSICKFGEGDEQLELAQAVADKIGGEVKAYYERTQFVVEPDTTFRI